MFSVNEARLMSWLNFTKQTRPVCWATVHRRKQCPPTHLSSIPPQSHGEIHHWGYGANGHRSSSPLPGFYLLLRLGFSLLVESGHQFISQSIIQTRRKPRGTCVSPSTAFALQLSPEAGGALPTACLLQEVVHSLLVQLPVSEQNISLQLHLYGWHFLSARFLYCLLKPHIYFSCQMLLQVGYLVFFCGRRLSS